MFGGAVPNPVHLLAKVVADLHDADGRVTLPGFYDRVRPLTASEEASLAALPFDEQAWMENAGVRRLDGEAGQSTLARIGYRPTAEAVGFGAGYTGDGMKTIVPAEGGCKITFRLVADQAPAEPAKNLKAMRVSDLLRMSTGHQAEPSLRGEGDWARAFLAQEVPHKPGTHFLYNTAATYMLSAIVQRATGSTVLVP